MSWTPGVGVSTSIGLGVGYKEPITLSPSRANRDAYLIIGDHVAEILLQRTHVEALRNQIPVVLAGLDQADAENATCDRANATTQRAVNAAAGTLDQALGAERAGDTRRAAELRAAAEKARAAADAVDAAVAAVADATLTADDAAEYATNLATGRTPGDVRNAVYGHVVVKE